MELQDAAALQELSHRNGERWGTNTALWVIAAVVVIAFVPTSGHVTVLKRLHLPLALLTWTDVSTASLRRFRL